MLMPHVVSDSCPWLWLANDLPNLIGSTMKHDDNQFLVPKLGTSGQCTSVPRKGVGANTALNHGGVLP